MSKIFLSTLTLTFTCWLSLGSFFTCFERIRSIYNINDSHLKDIMEDDAFINLFSGSSCDTISSIWDNINDNINNNNIAKEDILIAYENKDILFFTENKDNIAVLNVVDFIESSFDNLNIFEDMRYNIDKTHMAISTLYWIIQRQMQYDSVISFCNEYDEREEILNDLLTNTFVLCDNNNNENMRRLIRRLQVVNDEEKDDLKAQVQSKICNNSLLSTMDTTAVEIGISGSFYIGFEYTKGFYLEVETDTNIRFQKYNAYGGMLGLTKGVGIMVRSIKLEEDITTKDLLAPSVRLYSGDARLPDAWEKPDINPQDINISNINIGDDANVDFEIFGFDFVSIAKGEGQLIGVSDGYLSVAFTGTEKVHGEDWDTSICNTNNTNNSYFEPEPIGKIDLFGILYRDYWTSPNTFNTFDVTNIGNWTFDIFGSLTINNDDLNTDLNTIYWIADLLPSSNQWSNYTVKATIDFADNSPDGSIGIIFAVSGDKAYYFGIKYEYWEMGVFTSNGYEDIDSGKNKQISNDVKFVLNPRFVIKDDNTYNIDFYYTQSGGKFKTDFIWVTDFLYEDYNGEYPNMPIKGSVGVLSRGKKGTIYDYEVEFYATNLTESH